MPLPPSEKTGQHQPESQIEKHRQRAVAAAQEQTARIDGNGLERQRNRPQVDAPLGLGEQDGQQREACNARELEPERSICRAEAVNGRGTRSGESNRHTRSGVGV